ncbi:MAG: LPXTG cell wall anchor domain-containing protein, partial [Eubacteriales bacterium]
QTFGTYKVACVYDSSSNVYTFTVKDLPEGEFVKVVEGGQTRYDYKKYDYSFKETAMSGFSVSYRSPADQNTPISYDSKQYGIEDGGMIVNTPISYTLPATGGVGTGVVYGAGAAVILLALLGLVLMNRKRGRGTGI